MKITFRFLTIITLMFCSYMSRSQGDLPEDFTIELRPLVDPTTGLNDSNYVRIESVLTKILGEKFRVSEFSAFPYKLVARCMSENDNANLGEEKESIISMDVKLNLVDVISGQSFGEKTFRIGGGGKTNEEAFEMSMKFLEKEQKDNIISFVDEAFISLYMCYESKCDENMEKMRMPPPSAMPEDMLINLMSIPAMLGECKMRANEDLIMMYSDYCINKCEELNQMLGMAIEQKNKKDAKEFFTKMSYLYGCEEQVEQRKEKLMKMKIPVGQILAKSKDIKFDPMEVDRTLLSKKVSKILLLVMDDQMGDDPGMNIMKMEEIKRILEE